MASSAQGGNEQRERQGQPRRHAPGRQHDGKHHGHIVSLLPGRMRVRLHRSHRGPAEMKQIEQELGRRDGITSVTTDARTGSVLVQYDHRTVSKDDLVAMLYDVGVVAREVLGAEALPIGREGGVVEHSTAATGVLDALTDLDRRISELTDGKVDLKLLMPLGLGLLAARQILTTGGLGLAEVPAYVLLWYTFDSFYKLHQRKAEAMAAMAAKHVERTLEGGHDPATAATVEITPSGS
jgi:hypothetical protein